MATLEELEGKVWGEPDFNSHLVTTCYRLRKKPVETFSVDDLRIMIGQAIGLKHLVPRALAVLEVDPLAGGDFGRGDLMSAFLRESNWFDLEFFRPRVEEVARKALSALETSDGGEVRLGEWDTLSPRDVKKLIDEINLYLNRPRAMRPRKGKGD